MEKKNLAMEVIIVQDNGNRSPIKIKISWDPQNAKEGNVEEVEKFLKCITLASIEAVGEDFKFKLETPTIEEEDKPEKNFDFLGATIKLEMSDIDCDDKTKQDIVKNIISCFTLSQLPTSILYGICIMRELKNASTAPYWALV